MNLFRYRRLLEEIFKKLEAFNDGGYFSYPLDTIRGSADGERFQNIWRGAAEKISLIRCEDPHTGLWNRKLIFLLMESALSVADLDARPTCVALIDVDRMKHFNDYFGLGLAERMLLQIASVLKSHFHPRHWVGRTGGDEFLLVMNCGLAEAKSDIQTFQSEFRALNPLDNIPSATVTLRIGLTSLTKDDTIKSCMTRLEDSIHYGVRDALVTV